MEVLEQALPADPPVISIDELKQRMKTYLKPGQVRSVVRAYKFAENAHDGQWRQTGDAYITHPLAVADILAGMRLDHECLMAALLHDVIEDTEVAKEVLGDKFGHAVVEIVDGVSKLKVPPVTSRTEAQAENLQKMVQAMGKDVRVLLVKLADRLHNMRTLQVLDPEKRRRIARETLEIYAPIARRLGMNNVRVELEELGFRGMHPWRCDHIGRAVARELTGRRELIEEMGDKLRSALTAEGIDAEVTAHQRHLYSIYNKMRTEDRRFADIMYVQGFRIIVRERRDCYAVLGSVHSQYTPVNGSFSDYISAPKTNGYQSLHTTLLGGQNMPIDIQIRTEQMNRVASHGITSQWLDGTTGLEEPKWIQDLVEMQARSDSSVEFVEAMKADLTPAEVYVLMPGGGTLALPQGATAVDFAYAVHENLGNSCVSCLINRRPASLSDPLKSGQRVEIITAVDARPQADWLSFVVTPRARGGIRHALRRMKRSDSIRLGQRWLGASLQRHQRSLDSLEPDALAEVLKKEGLADLNQLLEKIGLGQLLSPFVAAELLGMGDAGRQAASDAPLAISGTERLAVSYAACCGPIPGDPIAGRVNLGQGIEVHVENCERLQEARARSEEEVLGLRWEESVQQEFLTELRTEIERERDSLASLASAIARGDACLEDIRIVQQDAHVLVINARMRVRDRVHLAAVIRRVRHLRGVSRVTRVGS